MITNGVKGREEAGEVCEVGIKEKIGVQVMVWAGLAQVRLDLGQVLVGSQADPRQVSVKSRASSEQFPARSWVGVGRVRRFENEMLKVKKWFTVFKIINHFPKIKERFSVKRKIFFVNHYFTS